MEHVEEFQKLFKIKIPVEGHFDYYIDTLAKSGEFENIHELIKEFEQYEKDVKEMGYSSPVSYKLDHVLPKMKKFILGTFAYGQLQAQPFSKDKYIKKDERRKNDGEFLLSIDFKEANFNALRIYDDPKELGKTWKELCDKLDVHPTLAKSKSFREYVFGNTNPKRLQKVQHLNVLSIIAVLKNNEIIEEEDVVFISEDELIIRLPNDIVDANNVGKDLFSKTQYLIDNGYVLPMPVHYKVLRNKAIGKKMAVQEVFEFDQFSLKFKYKTLFLVPSHKYFKYFKKHVVGEPIETRDLLFMNDGEIAIWAEDEDSIAGFMVPEGEMTIEQVKTDYGYWFNKLKEEIPSLKDSQIRKIICVSMNVCQSCHNADGNTCKCWNDE